jgi:hypothetical protein
MPWHKIFPDFLTISIFVNKIVAPQAAITNTLPLKITWLATAVSV